MTNEFEKLLNAKDIIIPDKDKQEPEIKDSAKKKKQPDIIPQIDLHGETARKSLTLLSAFLKKHTGTALKVLVIHGKGLHSTNKESILKAEIRQYLKAQKQNKSIRDFSKAPYNQGGEGATLVWLNLK